MYTSIGKRRDSYFELGLALASASQVESVVALSESSLNRRKFASVYESLSQVKVDQSAGLDASLGLLEPECGELDGVAVYSGDSTFIKRSEAKRLEARTMKRLSSGARVLGHDPYWTMRLRDTATRWVGVALVERMKAGDTLTSKAAEQMKLIGASSPAPKLFVLDAGHGKDVLKLPGLSPSRHRHAPQKPSGVLSSPSRLPRSRETA